MNPPPDGHRLPFRAIRLRPLGLSLPLLLAACSETARLPEHALVGPEPTLLTPVRRPLPTVDIAPAVGWPTGGLPRAAAGLQVVAMANALDHPRWLHVLPNGDVLVAESNKPPRPPGTDRGLVERTRDWVMARVMKRAGAGVPSADRLTLLRDADGDGVAEFRSPFAQGLPSPFGMALVGEWLYVGVADGVVRLPYREGVTRVDMPAERVATLPGGLNHHWTKSLVASPDGQRLYAGVGSNSNVAERGLQAEVGRAAIWEIDLATRAARPYATGLRNPVGLAFAPATATTPARLHAVVNERDELGSDLVPDYLTAVQAGGFYGWPWFYWGSTADPRVKEPPPPGLPPSLRPDFALGSHVAPLGLAWQGEAPAWPETLRNGFFIGLHGSWNRKPLTGYEVVFVPLRDGRPALPMQDVLTGFLNPAGQAQGRPAGVAIDRQGGLLVADDVGNTVWRVAPAALGLPALRPTAAPIGPDSTASASGAASAASPASPASPTSPASPASPAPPPTTGR